MLECVKNIVNTDVFDRFHFFDFFVNFEFPGLDFGAFWVLFGVLRTHLDDLRESLKQGGVWLARLAGQGDPRFQSTRQKGCRLVVPGGRKQPIQ